MGTTFGRYEPPRQSVSITHTRSSDQIQFDYPSDMLITLQTRPDLRNEILAGEWVWTTQPVYGGN